MSHEYSPVGDEERSEPISPEEIEEREALRREIAEVLQSIAKRVERWS